MSAAHIIPQRVNLRLCFVPKVTEGIPVRVSYSQVIVTFCNSICVKTTLFYICSDMLCNVQCFCSNVAAYKQCVGLHQLEPPCCLPSSSILWFCLSDLAQPTCFYQVNQTLFKIKQGILLLSYYFQKCI